MSPDSSGTPEAPGRAGAGRYSFQLPELPGGMRPLRGSDAAEDE